ncbi:MAG: hypothetical protein R3321_07390, partial [Nitrososphaeraceae archaeon]|nr:hypothetical protein [Nitrososphaeraceae archaeon]
MAKDTQINFRINSGLKQLIENRAKAEGYASYTQWILDICKKELCPDDDSSDRQPLDNQLEDRLNAIEETLGSFHDRFLDQLEESERFSRMIEIR